MDYFFKRKGQRPIQSKPLDLPVFSLQKDDKCLAAAKFTHHLAADAARRTDVAYLSPALSAHNGDLGKVPLSLRHRLEKGGALGTAAGPAGGVFNVAAQIHLTVPGLQGRPHQEVGIGGVGPVLGDLSGILQIPGALLTPPMVC